MGRVDAANQLHDNVCVRGEHLLHIARPANVASDPVHALALHIAIEDVGQSKRRMRGLIAEYAGNRAAYRAKSQDGNFQRGSLRRGSLIECSGSSQSVSPILASAKSYAFAVSHDVADEAYDASGEGCSKR